MGHLSLGGTAMEQTLTRSDGTRAGVVASHSLSDQSGGNTSLAAIQKTN
jgi:hypothetical protein